MLFRDIRNNRRTRLSEETVDYREMATALEDCLINLDLIYWDVQVDIATNCIVISKKRPKNPNNLIKFANGKDAYRGDIYDVINEFDGTDFSVIPNEGFDYDDLKKALPDTIAAFNELERIRKCIAKHF